MGFKAVLSAATERSLWETACMALQTRRGRPGCPYRDSDRRDVGPIGL